jgi:hypothetical protein
LEVRIASEEITVDYTIVRACNKITAKGARPAIDHQIKVGTTPSTP